MNAAYHISYTSRKEIDPEKWELCITQSPNAMIYGSLSFLDHMAPHWDALILGDYKAIMPLTWNKKWGIRYLYQPPLSPQLGIFSPQPITEEIIKAFLQKATDHFRFAEIYLNFTNVYPGLVPFTNIVLDVNAPYEKIRAGYKKDLEKNLRKAARFPLLYTPSTDVDGAIDLYRKYNADKTPHVGVSGYRSFAGFCHSARKTDSVIIRTAYAWEDEPLTNESVPGHSKPIPADQADQPLLALALLLKQKSRLYLLMSVCTPAGRKVEANHFLLDNLIREFAGTDTILDFDGSEIPGIAHFYKNFGGIDQPFFFYRHNRLPWPIRLFKPAGTQLGSR